MNTKLPKDVEKRFDDLFEYIGIALDWYTMNAYSEKRKPGSKHLEDIKAFLATELERQRQEIAQECYLQCLAVECGEGECARAIRTKFNLKARE